MAFTLRTDDELERALDDLGAKEGLSRQDVVRCAVLERWARTTHRERVDDAIKQAIARWRDVLDRLGTA
jgi:predicted transcriptional regulator